jgi:hypothetical protein
MAALYDLYVEQGADFVQALDLHGDWTGNTLELNIIDSVGQIKSGTIEWTDIANGSFKISLTSQQSSSITSGVGRYNVEATKTSTGYIDRIIQGRIYIDGDIK